MCRIPSICETKYYLLDVSITLRCGSCGRQRRNHQFPSFLEVLGYWFRSYSLSHTAKQGMNIHLQRPTPPRAAMVVKPLQCLELSSLNSSYTRFSIKETTIFMQLAHDLHLSSFQQKKRSVVLKEFPPSIRSQPRQSFQISVGDAGTVAPWTSILKQPIINVRSPFLTAASKVPAAHWHPCSLAHFKIICSRPPDGDLL